MNRVLRGCVPPKVIVPPRTRHPVWVMLKNVMCQICVTSRVGETELQITKGQLQAFFRMGGDGVEPPTSWV